MEGFGVERRPVEVEAAGELGGEVLGVGRAAAVAAEVDLAALPQGLGDHLRGLLDAALEIGVVENRLLHGDGLADGLGYSWIHHKRSFKKRREDTIFSALVAYLKNPYLCTLV